MPGIGSLIREIHIKIQKFERAKILLLSKTNARVQSVKIMYKAICDSVKRIVVFPWLKGRHT